MPTHDHEKSLIRGFRIYLGGCFILLIGSLGMVWAGIIADRLGDDYGAPVAVALGGGVIVLAAIAILLHSPELRTLRTRMPEAQRQTYQLVAAGDGD